ncbi:MAG: PE-PPE domain-containing protein, partial [Mycobacterium sp.]
AGVALGMGGSGVPIPPENLVQTAFDNYLVPKGFGDYTPVRVFTPEGLQPIDSGIKSLPFDTSVAQGVTILNDTIKAQLEAGNNVVVGGVSQSATINAIEMQDIANGSLGPDFTLDKLKPDQLQFLSLGDPSNPNGGVLSRFDLPIGSHPSIPSLGLTFSGAAPADTGIPTDIYTIEYDGFADFPRYPMNFVSDLNAVAGFAFAHPLYIQGLRGPGIGLTPQQIADAQPLPVTDGYDGGTAYYMVPNDNLPLAQLIEMIAGKPLADLLEPDLRVLANLGYGTDPTQGWSDGPANVATPFGLFPTLDSDQFNTILQALVDGAEKGFHDFTADLAAQSAPTGPAVDLFSTLAQGLADPPSFTDAVNAISAAAADAYAVLLPTADIINALTTSLPAYELSLFLDNIQAGDLADAIGLPAAANTGLSTIGLGFETLVLIEAVQNIESALSIFG